MTVTFHRSHRAHPPRAPAEVLTPTVYGEAAYTIDIYCYDQSCQSVSRMRSVNDDINEYATTPVRLVGYLLSCCRFPVQVHGQRVITLAGKIN